MDLSLTEEQELLRNTARNFMEREASKDALLEFDESETGFSRRHLAEGVGHRLAWHACGGGVWRQRQLAH